MPSRFRRTLIVAAPFIFVVLAFSFLMAWFSARPANTLRQTYRNNTYGLSLNLPADYTITEAPSVNAPIDIIEFGNNAGYVQLTIVPAVDDGSILTKDSILADYPYMTNTATEPFIVTPSVIGFTTDGNRPSQMSGLWFEQGGHLYQFSAYDAGLDQLPLIADTIKLF